MIHVQVSACVFQIAAGGAASFPQLIIKNWIIPDTGIVVCIRRAMSFVPASRLLSAPPKKKAAGAGAGERAAAAAAARPGPSRKGDGDGLLDDQRILTEALAALKMHQVPQALALLSRVRSAAPRG